MHSVARAARAVTPARATRHHAGRLTAALDLAVELHEWVHGPGGQQRRAAVAQAADGEGGGRGGLGLGQVPHQHGQQLWVGGWVGEGEG